jgi:trimeric autotransporter adhesin
MKRMSPVPAILATAGLAAGLLVAAAPSALGASAPGIITTVAGGAGRGYATNVAQQPVSLAAGPGDTVYVGDDGVVREFSSASAFEKDLAGQGPGAASAGNGWLASRASVTQVTGVTVDAAGNLVFATQTPQFGAPTPDPGGPWFPGPLWVVAAKSGTFYGQAMTAGHIYQMAQVTDAYGVAADHAGNVVITTFKDQQVKVLAGSTGTFYGQAMTAGNVYTIAGSGTTGYSGDGGPAAAAEFDYPGGVAIDPAGNVVVADLENQRIRVVAAASGTFYGQAMTAGNIYTIAGTGTAGYSGDGTPAAQAELSEPSSVATDRAGDVVIADTQTQVIQMLPAASGTFYGQAMTPGDLYTIAGIPGHRGYSGKNGPATGAKLNYPAGVAVDAAGNVLIADTRNHRIRAVAAGSGTFYHRSMTTGDIYSIAGSGDQLYSGDGAPARDAELEDLSGLAVNRFGDTVFSDRNHNRVRIVAGSSGTRYGLNLKAGDIYTLAGTPYAGNTGDGGPATAAQFRDVGGVATDRAGNVLIADSGNNRIQVVAASSGTFYGQAMTAGHIYTIAGKGTLGYSGDGGPATSAEFAQPGAVAVDANGNVLINDSGNDRVRVVAASSGTFYGQAMTAGYVYTIAGNGTEGYSGDGGPAISASLHAPDGVAVDQAGNVIIADAGNARVRVVAASSGTFYGQAMTAGYIYTIAGNGSENYSGDGGPGPSAGVFPTGVAVNSAGNVLIGDANDRIRELAG